jgi:hypothetical protein
VHGFDDRVVVDDWRLPETLAGVAVLAAGIG